MKTLDKVSIVIPVYNGEKYLDECIQSAINQTYQNIEIIAVNDGSTDGSLKILEKYSDKIKIISKENGGIASALNTGIAEATGEWIKWLSADDALYPNAIEQLLGENERHENKEQFIMYSNFDLIDSEGQVIGKQNEPNYNDLNNFDVNVILLDHFIGNGTTSLIHKSIIDKYGFFDKTLSHSQDYELWLRYCILHHCRLYLVPKTLAKYRIHLGQMTKTRIKKSIEQRDQVQNMILNKLDSEERKKYENALKLYKKNKPLIEKSKYFVRYNLFRILPSSISIKMVNAYWANRKRKTSF